MDSFPTDVAGPLEATAPELPELDDGDERSRMVLSPTAARRGD